MHLSRLLCKTTAQSDGGQSGPGYSNQGIWAWYVSLSGEKISISFLHPSQSGENRHLDSFYYLARHLLKYFKLILQTLRVPSSIVSQSSHKLQILGNPE